MTATQAKDEYLRNLTRDVGAVLERISKAISSISREYTQANIVLSSYRIYEDDIIKKEDHRNYLLVRLKELGYLKVEYFPSKFWGAKEAFKLPENTTDSYSWYNNKTDTCCSPYIHLDWSK